MKLNINTLRSVLRYEPETGLLYWLERPRSLLKSDHEWRRWNTRYAGKVAFSPNTSGYLDGMIFRVMHRAHQVAWALHYGEWPTLDIDHINGERTDNRIANLRQVDRATNARNQRVRRNNKTGVMGVSRQRSGGFRATICVNGKLSHLGVFPTLDEAAAARKKAERENGFHENHGRHGIVLTDERDAA